MALGLATSVFTLGACSEKTETPAETKKESENYTQDEVNQEAIKIVKKMFKHLDKEDDMEFVRDVHNDEKVFEKHSETYDQTWDSDKFIYKFSDNNYSNQTELSVVPQEDWGTEFKELKGFKNKSVILAKYKGEDSDTKSLILTVVKDKDASINPFRVFNIESFEGAKISILSDESVNKYRQEVSPYEYEIKEEHVNYSGADNFVHYQTLDGIIKTLKEQEPEGFGSVVYSVQRMDADKFLVKTDKVDAMVSIKDSGEKYAWQVTSYGTDEVLWESASWN